MIDGATIPKSSAPSSVKERVRWAAAQRTRRARAKAGESVFRLALHDHLVALALAQSPFAQGRDLTDHAECEAGLTEMVKQNLLRVIDDSSETAIRALLSRIKPELSSKLNPHETGIDRAEAQTLDAGQGPDAEEKG